jgi:hypothetical protein
LHYIISKTIYYINVKSPNLDLKQGISYLERESGRGPGGEREIDGRNIKMMEEIER